MQELSRWFSLVHLQLPAILPGLADAVCRLRLTGRWGCLYLSQAQEKADGSQGQWKELSPPIWIFKTLAGEGRKAGKHRFYLLTSEVPFPGGGRGVTVSENCFGQTLVWQSMQSLLLRKDYI